MFQLRGIDRFEGNATYSSLTYHPHLLNSTRTLTNQPHFRAHTRIFFQSKKNRSSAKACSRQKLYRSPSSGYLMDLTGSACSLRSCQSGSRKRARQRRGCGLRRLRCMLVKVRFDLERGVGTVSRDVLIYANAMYVIRLALPTLSTSSLSLHEGYHDRHDHPSGRQAL
jgi:hypothetical protein